MSYDVICSSADIRISYNKIQSYATYLVEEMSKYNDILRNVQEYAIEDELIRKSLADLTERINPQIRELAEVVERSVKSTCNREISEIAAADDFCYPDEILYAISSLLAGF